MTRRRMMGVKESGVLPSEYQQVEWIQTDNSSRIDSGVAFDGTRDFCLEAVAQIIAHSNHTAIMGWNAGGLFGSYGGDGRWYDGATETTIVATTMVKVEQVIYAGASSNTVTKFTAFNNPALTETVTRTHPNVSNRLALINYPLFAVSKTPPNWDYSDGNMRIYDIKLGFNGVFEAHLIPCYRKSDNSIGMYDIIKKSFRPNLGVGTFTKGADVN